MKLLAISLALPLLPPLGAVAVVFVALDMPVVMLFAPVQHPADRRRMVGAGGPEAGLRVMAQIRMSRPP